MKIKTLLICLLTSLTASCAMTYLQHNSTQLQPALTAFEAGNYDECDDLLSVYDTEDFILGAQHEFSYLRGMCSYHLGKSSLAIYFLSDYLELPGAVPAKMRVAEQILLDYADSYISGEIKVLWLFSSPGNGFDILETLAIFGTSIDVQAQSIARLAEHYLDIGRIRLAEPYYSMLLNPRFASLGWADRASFRFAECRYLLLREGKSDEQSIMYAYNSTQAYLSNFPGGLNRVDAQIIADDCVTRLAKLHFTIGEYYQTIDNELGAVHHFKLASGQESQGVSVFSSIIPRDNSVARLASEQLDTYAN